MKKNSKMPADKISKSIGKDKSESTKKPAGEKQQKKSANKPIREIPASSMG